MCEAEQVMNHLLAIGYSPWSEKARWALDHHRIDYQEEAYTPLLGELALRARLGQWSGRISVPTLLVEDRSIADSYNIANYAEENTQGAALLFPEANRAEIALWNERSERVLAAGRTLISSRVLANEAAKREALPAMPALVKRFLYKPLAAIGGEYLSRKYQYRESLDSERLSCDEIFTQLAGALEGGDYLVGNSFTYADLAMAVGLQIVQPVVDGYIRLGPATRVAWTDEALLASFPGLIAWRDRIYSRHRSN